MAVFKKVMKDSAKEAGILSGNAAAQNAQTATNMAADGMKLFQEKAAGPIIQNGTFATGKGNLFEYIEAAKFNTAAGRAGSTARAIITDAAGDPHAVADILIKDKGRTVKAVQAKFTQAYSKGKDVSAARSVAEQTGQMNKGWGQYDGMDRLIRKQENYDADLNDPVTTHLHIDIFLVNALQIVGEPLILQCQETEEGGFTGALTTGQTQHVIELDARLKYPGNST